jgi:hypothetical protein
MAVDRLDQDVNVVGHDYPCKQAIAFAVEMLEGVIDNASNLGSAQNGGASAFVQNQIQPPSALVIIRK